MNNKPLTPAASLALIASGIFDVLIGSVMLGARFGFLPWDFAEMFGIPEMILTIIGAILIVSGLAVIAFAVTRQNEAPPE